MYNRQTVRDLAKPIPKLYHIFRRRRSTHRTHELIKISSVRIFQNDIVGAVINKASVIGDYKGGGFVILSEIYECIVLGFVLFFSV